MKVVPGPQSIGLWSRTNLCPATSHATSVAVVVDDLVEVYTPTAEEFALAVSTTARRGARLGFLVLLKTFQRLGQPSGRASCPPRGGPPVPASAAAYRPPLRRLWPRCHAAAARLGPGLALTSHHAAPAGPPRAACSLS